MMVQMTAVPPTTEAITIKTVVTVFCIWAFFAGTPVAVADAADTSLVSVTMVGGEPFLLDVITLGAEDVTGSGAAVVKGAVVVGSGGTDETTDATGADVGATTGATTELTMLLTMLGVGATGATELGAGATGTEMIGSLGVGGAGADVGLGAAEVGAGPGSAGGTRTGPGLTMARFLIKRLRAPCSRGRGASFGLAVELVIRARARVRAKMSVRVRPLDFGMNIMIYGWSDDTKPYRVKWMLP
jgi:hypothetical protein